MASKATLPLVLVLAAFLPLLSHALAGQHQQLAGLHVARQQLRTVRERLTLARKKSSDARAFMVKARGFVAKARRLGVGNREVNRYQMDFHQVVDIERIPELLEQTRSETGRYYVPRKLEIARQGMSRGRSPKALLREAESHRNKPYTLAFRGDVLVMSNGK